MGERIIKKGISKPATKAKKVGCTKKSSNSSIGKPSKKIEMPRIKFDDSEFLKTEKNSYTIFELRDAGSKLFKSDKAKFNSLVDSIARELNRDNYGVAYDFANMNLNNDEFNGYEQGCLGSICGCITSYLVGLHQQQRNEIEQGMTL